MSEEEVTDDRANVVVCVEGTVLASLSLCKSPNPCVYVWLVLPMSPFSMALMSGLSRQSVGASILSMPGSSSFSVMAKLVKLYI